jgi:RND family efflux transporter MFP subunit
MKPFTRLAHPLRFGLILAITGASAARCSSPAVEDIETTGPLTVRTEAAKLDLIQTAITVTGTVTPAPGADWTITAPDAGRILELPKAEGDAVKTGDLLAKFEIPSLTSELIARQSESLQAAARLQNAKTTATRLTGLVGRGIAPQKELDDAERELQEAEAAVRQTDAAREAAELLAARTVIRARFDGVVARRWHNPGDSVEASSTDPVLRVIDPARLEVTALVPASQLALITPGHAVKVFNPTDGSEIAGTVITRPASVDGMTAAGEVRLAFGATPAGLTVGTPVQAEITGDSQDNVLVVPSLAIFHEGDMIFVVVAGADGKAHHRPVSTGIVTRDKTQITTGLVAGDQVILSGSEPVPDGADITVAK